MCLRGGSLRNDKRGDGLRPEESSGPNSPVSLDGIVGRMAVFSISERSVNCIPAHKARGTVCEQDASVRFQRL